MRKLLAEKSFDNFGDANHDVQIWGDPEHRDVEVKWTGDLEQVPPRIQEAWEIHHERHAWACWGQDQYEADQQNAADTWACNEEHERRES